MSSQYKVSFKDSFYASTENEAYEIFKDRMKAIELCVSRFDSETKTAFLDLYSKVDVKVNPETETIEPTPTPAPNEEIPF